MKKILAILLALAMFAALCACGGQPAEAPAEEPAAEAEAPAEEPAAEPEAEPETEPEEAPEEPVNEEPTGEPSGEPGEASGEPTSEPAEIGEFTTLEEGKLTISSSPDFPPYEYYDDDGVTIIGIEPEILQLIADRLGLELVIDAMDFDSALLAVQQGKSDMVVSGCTVTEDRKLVMNFTDSYTTAKQVIVVPVGSEVTLDTLGDYDIGTQRGTTGYIYTTDDYGEDHVIGYDTYTLAFQALQNGQVDCIVLDDAVGYAYVDQIPGLEVLDTEYVVEDYAFGVDKDNAELLEAVNLVLNAMMDEGLVQDIIDEYISD